MSKERDRRDIVDRALPASDELDEMAVEIALDASAEEIEQAEAETELQDVGDPFGLWALARELNGQVPATIVYGDAGPSAVFADCVLADAIDLALPVIERHDLDFTEVVPWVERAMIDVLPEGVADRYCQSVSSALDGQFYKIDPEMIEVVAEELRRLGFICQRDDALISRITGHS